MCGVASHRGEALSASFIAAALAAFVEVPPPPALGLRQYTMCRCPQCALEFAEPLAPAGEPFYAWLDENLKYYDQRRWEWDRVEAQVAGHRPSASVLEIGAGDGRFLRRLRDAGARTVAIERPGAATAALRAQGIESFAQDEAAIALAGRRFDFVLAFHCLEHVADPVALLESMRHWAGPAGRVLFSVPFSPMFFERRWFDPLNHPPHHLTRWNARALARLAERCGTTARLQLPAALPLLTRARHSLAIQHFGAHWKRHPAWRWLPLRQPLRFAVELLAQLARERVDGRVAADVVLVEVPGR